MSTIKTYPVVETFVSIQGEGTHTGKNMLFVRLFGCNLKCSFCDEPKHTQKGLVVNLDQEDILNLADEAGIEWVCITGGEPSLHDLTDLIGVLQTNGYNVAIETNGLNWSNVMAADHVCISPKSYPMPVGNWDAVKVLVEAGKEDYYAELLEEVIDTAQTHARNGAGEVYLQPINEENELNTENVQACLDLIEDYPVCGLSIQMHKVLGVE